MIRSFRDRETETVFAGEVSRRLPRDIQQAAFRRLTALNAATSLEDLRTPPGNRLERLAGNRAGQYSIRINSQWRVCFTWDEGHANNVEITDYH